MDTLEIEHPQLTSYTLYVDGAKHSEGRCDGSVSMALPYGDIELWINPIDKHWGILPRIRIDGFLVNTFLASIDVYDHMLRFTFDESFFRRYANKNIESIIASVPERHRNDEEYISKYFGLSGSNAGLVQEIRSLLDAKSNIHNHT
jgi:hypothetical protein